MDKFRQFIDWFVHRREPKPNLKPVDAIWLRLLIEDNFSELAKLKDEDARVILKERGFPDIVVNEYLKQRSRSRQ